MVVLSIGSIQGHKKDTARNILREKECVIHMADASMIKKMNVSAKKNFNKMRVKQKPLTLNLYLRLRLKHQVLKTPFSNGM